MIFIILFFYHLFINYLLLFPIRLISKNYLITFIFIIFSITKYFRFFQSQKFSKNFQNLKALAIINRKFILAIKNLEAH